MDRQRDMLDDAPPAPIRSVCLADLWAGAGRPAGANPRRWRRSVEGRDDVGSIDEFGGKVYGDEAAAEAYRRHLAGE